MKSPASGKIHLVRIQEKWSYPNHTTVCWRVTTTGIINCADKLSSNIVATPDLEIIINTTKLMWRLELCFDLNGSPYFKLTYLSNITVLGKIEIVDDPDECWPIRTYLLHSWNGTFKRGYTREFLCDTETIICTIHIDTQKHMFQLVSITTCNSSTHHNSRQRVYAKLLIEGTFSDATLSVEDGTVFAIHRAILAVHSTYFAKLFEEREQQQLIPSKEGDEDDVSNVYKLDNVTDYTLQQLLKYVYTEEIKLEVLYLPELCVAAARFGVDDLKQKCCEAIENILTKDTAVDILHKAEAYNAVDLRDVVIRFMLTKHPEIMVQSPKLREYAKELAEIVKHSLSLK